MEDRELKKRNLRQHMLSSESEYNYSDAKEELEEYTKKRTRNRRVIIIIVVAAIITAIVAFFLYSRFYRYTSYSVAWEKELGQGSFTGYEHFGDRLLKYSRDGVTCLEPNGTEIWTESYEIKAPQIEVNGEFAVISDISGNTLMIFGRDGRLGTATTLLPILRASISASGVVAVIEDNTSSGVITFFRKDGSALDITMQTVLSGDGYPTALSLSPDGTQLMVSFQFIKNGQMMGRVAFYDFSEKGKNIPTRLIAGIEDGFTDSLIAKVSFVNSTDSYAVADTGIYFFSSRGSTAPDLKKAVVETDEIECVFTSEKYVGLILNDPTMAGNHRIELYKSDGTEVLRKEFQSSYSSAQIYGDYIYIFGSGMCTIFNLSGRIKFSEEMDLQLNLIMNSGLPDEFIAAGPGSIYKLKLQ